MRNEQTSARVAKTAGRILAIHLSPEDRADFEIRNGFKWSELRSLAASALNQAPDRPKKKGWVQRRNLEKPRSTKGGHPG